ncbi:hypothetical protein [Caldimonas sp. KR1-144]|uniref:hypothetical protein n=1 Tax=Caldimonas sp. KR1-144 TaxID=3400911 RepID=UPI003C08C39D
MKSWICVTPAFSSVFDENTFTDDGTSTTLSARLRAVTTTASSCAASFDAVGFVVAAAAAAGSDAAGAGAAGAGSLAAGSGAGAAWPQAAAATDIQASAVTQWRAWSFMYLRFPRFGFIKASIVLPWF